MFLLLFSVIDYFSPSFINYRLVKEKALTNFRSEETDQLLMAT